MRKETGSCQTLSPAPNRRHGRKRKRNSAEKIVTVVQGLNESVTSYVNRHRDRFNNLNRQVERQNVQRLRGK